MATTIGIPRALFYYKYYPLWKQFFEEIGAELVPSAPNCRRIMDDGIGSCVGEACLPLKVWFGHAMNLRGRADMLFAPRYMSVSRKEFICPKFGGLPDMARSALSGLPDLLTPEVNLHDRADGGFRAAVAAGRRLGVKPDRARRAYAAALQGYLKQRQGNAGRRAYAGAEGRRSVLLLGHPYTTGDNYLNMNIVRKLSFLGLDVLTLNDFDGRALRQAAASLEKPMFWQYGTEALGCAVLLAQNGGVDGVVYLTCFGCGIDSFVAYMVERRLRAQGIPFTLITLDEHTGEAGLETRLEAFADSLLWRAAQ